MPLNELSNELIAKIFSLLDSLENYKNLCSVNKHLKSVIDTISWREAFKKHFPFYYPFVKYPDTTDWLNEYANAYLKDRNDHCANLPRILYLVKEGHLNKLQQYPITYEMLSLRAV